MLYPVAPTSLVEDKDRPGNTTEHPAEASHHHIAHHENHQTSTKANLDNLISTEVTGDENTSLRFEKEIVTESNNIIQSPVSVDQHHHQHHQSLSAAFPQLSTSSEIPLETSSSFGKLFDNLEIATDEDPLANIDIIVEEVDDDKNQKHNEVKEVFKSPVSSLTLPAVATKLAQDLDEDKEDFSKESVDLSDDSVPIIDLSSLDLFSSNKSVDFFNADEITLFETVKDKRNPELPIIKKPDSNKLIPNSLVEPVKVPGGPVTLKDEEDAIDLTKFFKDVTDVAEPQEIRFFICVFHGLN